MKRRGYRIVAAMLGALVALSMTMPALAAGGPGSGRKFTVPRGLEVAPGVIKLRSVQDGSRTLDGYAFVHYRGGKAKGGNAKAGKGGGGPTCYAFLGKGARWKATEDYLVDPANGAGLDEATVRALTAASLGTWDSEVAFDIFGSEVVGTVDGADSAAPDGKNEVLFADVDSAGAIAVTIVWGYFSGPPFARELIEWDQVYDDVDFAWSTSGEAGRMDYQNIATHELGHAAGMGHPDSSCTEETMYAYADYGETKKRDLNAGDIAGINALYPN